MSKCSIAFVTVRITIGRLVQREIHMQLVNIDRGLCIVNRHARLYKAWSLLARREAKECVHAGIFMNIRYSTAGTLRVVFKLRQGILYSATKHVRLLTLSYMED